MTKIRILPDILANQIAAGEVVERPASVVKELVENALDAGSSRILVDIEKGGRRLIRVGDNGSGMAHDEALLALERFATSKLVEDGDLFAIRTLGFRGEALPSIAAVSKLTLVTRSPGADSGVAVRIHGGKILEVTDTGAPPGTLITVEGLFYNTPARRKFLKTVNTEMGHIGDTVAGMALGYPGVHFKLTHNGRTIRQWTRTNDPARRVADVLGRLSGGELIALPEEAGEVRLTGHLGPPRLARSTSRGIYLYVNGRRVRDRVVQHALFEGYRGRLMKGQFPLAVLFLDLPFDQVDVNVHPTKHEIRFADQRRVHNLVRDRVARALDRAERRRWAVAPENHRQGSGGEGPPVVAQPGARYRIDTPMPPGGTDASRQPFVYQTRQPPSPAAEPPDAPQPPDRPEPLGPAPASEERPAPARQETLWDQGGFSGLTVIGQFHGTYIICQGPDGLLLIDQHAAHERIVYEELGRRAGSVASQRLLVPETIETGFAEAPLLERLLPELDRLGLEIEPFGGTTFVVKSVPVLLDDRDLQGLVLELVETAAGMGIDTGLEQVLDQCRMVMACHNAIRANQRLTGQQIEHMLRQLDRCRDPSHCPHGRPTWIHWSVKDLEKAFKRIV
jgi:DNA mismatch repair protein MutL